MKKLILSVLFIAGALAAKAEGISSPSGKLTLNFEVAENGMPVYEVSYKNQAVIKPSKMGLELKNERNLHRITSYNVCYTKLLRVTG